MPEQAITRNEMLDILDDDALPIWDRIALGMEWLVAKVQPGANCGAAIAKGLDEERQEAGR